MKIIYKPRDLIGAPRGGIFVMIKNPDEVQIEVIDHMDPEIIGRIHFRNGFTLATGIFRGLTLRNGTFPVSFEEDHTFTREGFRVYLFEDAGDMLKNLPAAYLLAFPVDKMKDFLAQYRMLYPLPGEAK